MAGLLGEYLHWTYVSTLAHASPCLEFPLLSFLDLNSTQESSHVLQKNLSFLLPVHRMVAQSQVDSVSNTDPATSSW